MTKKLYIFVVMTELEKINKFFEPIKENALKILDSEKFKKEIIFATTHLKRNPKLGKDQEGVLREVYNAMNLGFTLNPILDYGNLIPVWSPGGTQIQFRPTYKGFIWAAREFSGIKDVYSHVVYEGDDFRVSLGTKMEIHHEPKFQSKKIEKVYAVVITENGKELIEVMDSHDIDKVKAASDGYQAFKAKKMKSSPWHDYESEMTRKTCIKRLLKYLPKSEKFHNVIEADNREYMLDPLGSKAELIRTLLNSSTYDERMKTSLENSIYDMSTFKASEIIAELKDCQKEPIESGQNYGQGDILKQIDKKNENEKS